MWLRRISTTSVFLLALGGAVALADPPHSPSLAQNSEMPDRRARQPGLMEELNLSQEQKQEMEAIHFRNKDQIAQLQQELHQAQQELKELMTSSASTEEIRAKHKEAQNLQLQLGGLRFESLLAMREVMTQQQRLRFAELMQVRSQRFNEERKNHR
ncbi:MAG: periplasmic heavy metal sensor [Coleofasciculaceae cyanobacterium]